MSTRRRTVVRGILTDDEGNVLLARHELDDDETDHSTLWLVPGGGVEDGEALDEALRRELAEETGLTDFDPGTPVAIRRKTYRWNDDQIDATAYYFRVSTGRFDPTPQELSEFERETMVAYDWLSPEEADRLDAVVVPPELAEIAAASAPLGRVGDWAERRAFLTVGHSNRAAEEFVALLESVGVDCLVDVRSAPCSLFRLLERHEIAYEHRADLDGHGDGRSEGLRTGVERLEALATTHRNVAFMRAERDPERYLLSDVLWSRGHAILHVVDSGRLLPHRG